MAIVFGTTLRPENQPAADVAALLAKRLNVTLRLVHVSEDPRAPVVLGTDEEHILGPVRSTLNQEAARLHALAGIVVHPHLAAGAVVTALLSVAQWELAAALIVGSSPGSSRSLLGDTAERVSRKSLVPVITLREPERLSAWLRGERTLRVLVGADVGRAATAARTFGALLGKLGACEIEVVTVVSPREIHAHLGLPPPADDHVLAQEAEAALVRDLARSAPSDERATALRVLPARGGADAHLVSLADKGNFDIVIVGQRRHSILEQLWYSSVARGVLRSAPVSVACVPPPIDAPRPSFRPPRVVVVGTDFTEVGDRALIQAAGIASEGGTIHLAHVMGPPSALADVQKLREQAWYALTKLSACDAAGRPATLERHILEGNPADQLLTLATRVTADLIVLGARSHSPLARAVLGSVAQSIAERATMPVLLVPRVAT
ncbi:MAG: universal stress protein [Polyangiaceae bacterium]|nr:universal stress protein [Polyangiaceae bacterium]